MSGKVLAHQMSAAGRNADGHYEVANILGHTNISTTVKYSHLANDQVTQKAKNILTLWMSLFNKLLIEGTGIDPTGAAVSRLSSNRYVKNRPIHRLIFFKEGD